MARDFRNYQVYRYILNLFLIRYYFIFQYLNTLRIQENESGSASEGSSNESDLTTVDNELLYHGRRYDNESNLYYYRARYYDPILGRFLSADPMGYKDSMNLYQAFNMNGMNFVDPMGEKVYSRVEVFAAYTVMKTFGNLGQSFNEFSGNFGSVNNLSEYNHNGVTEYWYDSRNWDSGGDVIEQSGESYIHHDSSYTLVTITNHRYSWFFSALHKAFPGTRDVLGEEYSRNHSFIHPFDPTGQLNNERVAPEVERNARETVARYHIQDQQNPLYVSQGYRSFQQSNAVNANGTGAAGGYSWHNYGLAADIVFQNPNGCPIWPENAPWSELGSAGLISGFTHWGGNWTNPVDRPHHQYAINDSVPQVIRDIYNNNGGDLNGIQAVQEYNRTVLFFGLSIFIGIR